MRTWDFPVDDSTPMRDRCVQGLIRIGKQVIGTRGIEQFYRPLLPACAISRNAENRNVSALGVELERAGFDRHTLVFEIPNRHSNLHTASNGTGRSDNALRTTLLCPHQGQFYRAEGLEH
jgi:hypothetical protein